MAAGLGGADGHLLCVGDLACAAPQAHSRARACCIVFLALSALAGKYLFTDCGAYQEVVVQAEEIGMGVYGRPEYGPPEPNWRREI